MTETALHQHPPKKGKLTLPQSDVVPASLTAPFTGLPRLLILCFVGALVVVPLLATAIGGFKELGELRTNPFGLPKAWYWENYWGILASARYWRILGIRSISPRSLLP